MNKFFISFGAAALASTLSACAATAPRHPGSVSFIVNFARGKHRISRYIYGINTPQQQAGQPNPGLDRRAYRGIPFTFIRLGGDRWSAYNWTTNASNAGKDWRFSNDDYLDRSHQPGDAVRSFLRSAAKAHAAALITVPIIGYLAADEDGPLKLAPPATSPHFVREYPSRKAAGGHAKPHAVFQSQFVRWVKAHFPNGFKRRSRSPIYFSLDNEPAIWAGSHPEVHPQPTTYTELLRKSIAYASMIKKIAPHALVYGPADYGWEGFRTLQNAPDSARYNRAVDPRTDQPFGNFLSFYLERMRQAGHKAGRRLLDVLDIHWYPEAQGRDRAGKMVRIMYANASPGVVAARLQAPRSLWDPHYVENSWITRNMHHHPIDLLARLKREIAHNYPGTKLSVSEYDYGAGNSISGGIAEADVLGIWGRYGLYSAAEWPLLNKEPFILGAFRMYRNYNGHGGRFGATAVAASTGNNYATSIYASVTRRGQAVLVLLNKTSRPIKAAVALRHAPRRYATFRAYLLTAHSPLNKGGYSALPTAESTHAEPISKLRNLTLPAYSVTTLALHENRNGR